MSGESKYTSRTSDPGHIFPRRLTDRIEEHGALRWLLGRPPEGEDDDALPDYNAYIPFAGRMDAITFFIQLFVVYVFFAVSYRFIVDGFLILQSGHADTWGAFINNRLSLPVGMAIWLMPLLLLNFYVLAVTYSNRGRTPAWLVCLLLAPWLAMAVMLPLYSFVPFDFIYLVFVGMVLSAIVMFIDIVRLSAPLPGRKFIRARTGACVRAVALVVVAIALNNMFATKHIEQAEEHGDARQYRMAAELYAGCWDFHCDTRRAMELYEEAEMLAPDQTGRAQKELGEMYVATGRFDDAIRMYEESLKYREDRTGALEKELAELIYMRNGDMDRARELLRSAYNKGYTSARHHPLVRRELR